MYKNGISKNRKLAWHDSDDKDLPRFVMKKWIEDHYQSGRKSYNVNKKFKI